MSLMTYFDVNPFIIHSTPDTRLSFWKGLRNTLVDNPDALDILAEYWGLVPLGNSHMQIDDPTTWGTPWEMIHNGNWDRHMVAVGMEMTLRLSGWDASRLKIVSFRDYDISDEVTVLKIDNTYALNYNVGQVINWPNSEKIITDSWQFDGREYVSNFV